jgi:spore coat polysaccharide biosynthesis protein SpsF
MSRVIAVLQARMESTRLRGKIVAPVARWPLLTLIIERLKGAPLDGIWLATSTSAADDVTEAWGRSAGLDVFRGSEDDVLSRFAAIVADRDPGWVVRLTADDPFVDAGVVGILVDDALRAPTSVALLSDWASRRTPLGYVPQIARRDAILEAHRDAPVGSHHRAHVLTWLMEKGAGRDVQLPAQWPSRPQWRWTVDTATDLAMADAAFRLLGDRATTTQYEEMVALLDAHPDIAAMNAGVTQKPVEAA